ncbi:MAG: response regulator [Saprospiraceae bacterium]
MIRIIIVEDIDEIRNTIKEHLQSVTDFECVKVFANAEDALGGILISKPDVVLMDIGLPRMSGIECMLKVKQQYAEIKFLMFTVFEEDEKVFDALKAGADGYILKRESIQKIIDSIRELSNGGAPMSKSIALKILKSFRKETPKKLDVKLTNRQEVILDSLSRGLPYKLIAAQLSITIGTVKQHIHQIYKKLEVNNKTEAINKYLR